MFRFLFWTWTNDGGVVPPGPAAVRRDIVPQLRLLGRLP
jgi:hypothetical protein